MWDGDISEVSGAASRVPEMRAALDADREARFAGKEPGMISPHPTPGSGSRRRGKTRAPSWRNEVTLRSVDTFLEYEPGPYAP